jgi:hypothetical protein
MITLSKSLRFGVILGICLLLGATGRASADGNVGSSAGIKLQRGVMCERIEAYMPVHIAVAFSIEVGQISCFTSFADIHENTYALHKWYRRDTLVTSKKLTLKSPNWSTYSSIQLREADKGPWRVDILDADSHLLKTLRFSVTD